MSEFERRREADLLIEVGHPSRPDREDLMRQHIERIKARAWEEGARHVWQQLNVHAWTWEFYADDNPYVPTTAGEGERGEG